MQQLDIFFFKFSFSTLFFCQSISYNVMVFFSFFSSKISANVTELADDSQADMTLAEELQTKLHELEVSIFTKPRIYLYFLIYFQLTKKQRIKNTTCHGLTEMNTLVALVQQRRSKVAIILSFVSLLSRLPLDCLVAELIAPFSLDF